MYNFIERFTARIHCHSSSDHFPVFGTRIISPFEFMVALRTEPERGRRAFQHMASVVMLVICSDSQVQSLFIQLALLSNPDPSVWYACVAMELRRIKCCKNLELLTGATYLSHYKQYTYKSQQHVVEVSFILYSGLSIFTVCQPCVELVPGV